MTIHLDQSVPPSVRTEQHGSGVSVRGGWSRRLLLDSVYVMSAFPIALAGFSVTVVMLATGFALSPVVAGVLLLAVALRVARSFAQLERGRLRSMQGRRAPTPTYSQARPGDGYWRRLLTPLQDRRSWLDVSWTLVSSLSASAAFVLTLTWWVAAGGGLTYWFWQLFIPSGPGNRTLASTIGLGEGRGQESAVNFLIGVVALVTLPQAVRLAAWAHGAVAHALLLSKPEVEGLPTTRHA